MSTQKSLLAVSVCLWNAPDTLANVLLSELLLSDLISTEQEC